jgi:hypothetical protein
VVTRLIAVLGTLCLAGFVFFWWPGGLLLAGLGLIWLALMRADNERKGAPR